MEKSFFGHSHACPFCAAGVKEIDYKDVRLTSKYISERGKMTPARISGLCAKHQRSLAKAIKRQRLLALLPFINEN